MKTKLVRGSAAKADPVHPQIQGAHSSPLPVIQKKIQKKKKKNKTTGIWWLYGGKFYCDAHKAGIPFYFAPMYAKCAECSNNAPESYLQHGQPKEKRDESFPHAINCRSCRKASRCNNCGQIVANLCSNGRCEPCCNQRCKYPVSPKEFAKKTKKKTQSGRRLKMPVTPPAQANIGDKYTCPYCECEFKCIGTLHGMALWDRP